MRLKSFEAASKIKIIKAVRGVTNLGLKEVRAKASPAGPEMQTETCSSLC